MAVAQRMSEREYVEFVLENPDGAWELHDGLLVEKPRMTFAHGEIPALLAHLLLQQLDRNEYRVVVELRVRRSASTVLIPDVMVVPTAVADAYRGRSGLAVFTDPLPLVVEVWSPSTGGYDVDKKIPVYMQRGDREIWRIHPFEGTVTRWIRQPDGSYQESVHFGGIVSLVGLPGVTIDLDLLLAP
jgi:Uma2 family endonuclease